MADEPQITQAASPRRPSMARRIFRLLGIAGAGAGVLLVVAIVSILVLRPYWHLKGNFVPIFDFEGSTHYERVEKSRAEQKKQQKPIADPGSSPLAGASWPGYRGPNRDGLSTETGLLKTWPSGGPRELYRQPVGEGFAGFVIGGGRAFTVEQRRAQEAVTAYAFETGTELWVYEYPTHFKEQMGGDGPRATPTLDGERIYSLGSVGYLVALDAKTGKKIWDINILDVEGAPNLQWAMSGAPLVINEKLYVTSSGLKGPSVHAFDKATGEPLWKGPAQVQAYTSLMDVTLAGRRQILNFAGERLMGLDIETGQILWSFPWQVQNYINCAQPLLAGENRVFISSGYGKGCALVQIEPAGEKLAARQIWANTNMKNKFNSSVVHGGHIYGLDEGVLACVEIETGKRAWKGGRYGHGQLMLADGNLIVLGEGGQLALVEASPGGFKEISSFQALHSKTWNVPALAGGRLLVRNGKEMACFDLLAGS